MTLQLKGAEVRKPYKTPEGGKQKIRRKNYEAIPRILYRFLDAPQFADEFVAGRVRVSTLSACRACEDAERGDSGEGQLLYQPGDLFIPHAGQAHADQVEMARRLGIRIGPHATNTRIEGCIADYSLDDGYLLCFTESFNPDMKKNFGNACVAITDIPAFFDAITKEFLRVDPRLLKPIAGRVVYNGREFGGIGPLPPPGLAKPPRYAWQQECRMLWPVRRGTKITPMFLDDLDLRAITRRIL